MNAITEIIQLMNSDEKKEFIAYLSKRNKRRDTGNIILFKSLETDDLKLHTLKSNDAYHALRKRLYDNLVDFMAKKSFEKDTSEEQGVLRLLIVSRMFYEHQLYKTASRCLSKAEAKALALDNFGLLNEIYQAQVQFAHLDPSVPLNDVIDKYSANKIRLSQEERLNIAYALLRRELADIYYRGKIVDFTAFIKSTMQSYNISLRHALTFRSLYQILYIANEYASINHNYRIIEPFIIRSYHFISRQEHQAGRHLYYHIYILYFIANAHFRNSKFKEAGQYLAHMLEHMENQGRRYHNLFIPQYHLLQSLILNYTGNPQAAIQTAQKALQHKKAEAKDINNLRLALTVFHIQQNEPRAAHTCFKEFTHSDNWYEKKMGMDWAIKKNLVEIILHAELENTEFSLARIRSFKRRSKHYLQEAKETRVLAYLQLVERFIARPEIIASTAFRDAVAALHNTGSTGPEDIFVMSFIGWISAKTAKKPVYETTLALLGQSSPFHSA